MFFILILFALPAMAAEHLVISSDTVWSGEVAVSEDVLIMPGTTLTIRPGTIITVSPCESTQTQPEFLSPLTEITVRGNLVINGSKSSPVTIVMPGTDNEKEWAGIYIDGGSLAMAHTTVSGADAALTVISGKAEIADSELKNNRRGLVVMKPEAEVRAANTAFTGNDYGIVLLNGARIDQQDCLLADNEKQDLHERDLASYIPEAKVYTATKKDDNSEYHSESLLGTVIWKDRVIVNGIVRVPAKSRLIIMPGTVVEFTRNDTNEDGIGENGLLVMGMLVAKGTEEKPIIFRSAEKNPQRGDWDSINIYTSDGFQNLIEYCQIEHAYRAVHLHFSNVVINNSILRDNYRALQFQESLVEVTGNDIYNNKSAMRARDSELVFLDNRVYDNYLGPYIFRITGKVINNRVTANYLDGLRIREGALAVENNYLAGNKYGLAVAYSMFGDFTGNVMTDNVESGINLKGTEQVDVAGNFVQGNGGNGISLLNSQAMIKGNHITDNGERGIGINSFTGVITENNLLNNKFYAIGLDSSGDVSAPGNWYGGANLGEVIFDKTDDPSKGSLDYGPVRSRPVSFTWPLAEISDDTVWDGEFVIPRKVTLRIGKRLSINPGSRVEFAKDRGMWVNGIIEALGKPQNRIRFTVRNGTSGDHWHQLMVEKGGGQFAFCDFEYSGTAIHSHDSEIKVDSCIFRHNIKGNMFKGGHVEISRSSFIQNDFGIVPNLAVGRVTENLITDNKVGILVRDEKEGKLAISENNIFANSRYDLQMGELNSGDIDVTNNWWGQGDPDKRIFDERDEPGVGRAVYKPYAKEPFEEAVQSEK